MEQALLIIEVSLLLRKRQSELTRVDNTNSWWFKDPRLRQNVLHCVGLYFCVFYPGYDASLLNGLQAMPQWKKYFHSPNSSYLGLISATSLQVFSCLPL